MPDPAEAADHRPLSERVRPVKLDQLVGNPRAVADLRAFGQAWATSERTPRERAALLMGPPGVGKTTAALALANEYGWTVVEMNASEARNQAAIEQVAGRAALTHTLGATGTYRLPSQGGRTLILLDEADCLTGRAGEESGRRRTVSFREFVRGRYQSLGALASAWGLGQPGAPAPFASWEAVPASGGRGAWSRLPAAQRDLNEWHGVEKPADQSDRGGLGAIARLVRDTLQPVVITVNDDQPLTRYSPVFRSGVVRIPFYPVDDVALRAYLKRAILAERLTVSSAALDAIVRRSRGDVRAAVNDLEAVAPLEPGPLHESVLGYRDLTSNFFDVVGDVFRHPRFYRSVELRDRLDATPDDLLPWIEENVPRFAPDARARERGYAATARAEQFLARARRQRVWALWSFASELMTGGVALALTADAPVREGPVAFPQFLGEMGRTRYLRATRVSVVNKMDAVTHVSRRKGHDLFLPYLERLFADPPGPSQRPHLDAVRQRLVRELGLTAEEVAFLLHREVESEEVGRLMGPPPEPEPKEAAPAAAESPTRPMPRRATKKAPQAKTPAKAPPRRRVQSRLAEF